MALVVVFHRITVYCCCWHTFILIVQKFHNIIVITGKTIMVKPFKKNSLKMACFPVVIQLSLWQPEYLGVLDVLIKGSNYLTNWSIWSLRNSTSRLDVVEVKKPCGLKHSAQTHLRLHPWIWPITSVTLRQIKGGKKCKICLMLHLDLCLIQ